MRARDNPYRTNRLHSLAPRLRDISWAELMERVNALGCRGCVLGPHGSGKTAILLKIVSSLRNQELPVTFHSIRKNESLSLPLPASNEILILDGADLLERGHWQRISTQPRAGLLISSHHRRLLPVLYRCCPSPRLLADLIQDLHPGDGCGQPSALDLFNRHQGNLREALLELYDYHAGLTNPPCSRALSPNQHSSPEP